MDDIHAWFELSYASFAVLPRSILQSMPDEWQYRFVELMREIEALGHVFPAEGKTYEVMVRDDRSGRLSRDPLGQYDRGRRIVKPTT